MTRVSLAVSHKGVVVVLLVVLLVVVVVVVVVEEVQWSLSR